MTQRVERRIILIDGKTRDFNRRSVRSEMGIVLQIRIYLQDDCFKCRAHNESIQPDD